MIMKFDRRLILSFDWTLFFMVLGICLIGFLNIYSTGYSLDPGYTPYYVRQGQWIIIGLFFMIVAFAFDYRLVSRYAYVIYGLCMFLLVVVLLYGYATRGSQRWIALGGFTFQPSELMKLATIMVLARYFDDHKLNSAYSLKDLFLPFLLVVVPFVLILKQPDLGTAMTLMIIFGSLVFFVGIEWKTFLITLVGFLALIPTGWHFLKGYQKERLLTFLSPEKDPLGTGYHILQSIIAIGSGGIFGKGFLHGTQTQLKFLPEQQTDFIFSVFAEEWGFIGAIVLLTMFLSLILWGLKIAMSSRDLLGSLISFGITSLIFWEVFINMGMVLGILPVVGIPLPFMSYGGSAMVVMMTAMGLLMNISMRRFILRR